MTETSEATLLRRLAEARELLQGPTDESRIYDRLGQLLIPDFTDSLSLWWHPEGDVFGAARTYGVASTLPPPAYESLSPGKDLGSVWVRATAGGRWIQIDPERLPQWDVRSATVFLASTDPASWLVVERRPRREPFDTTDLLWLRELGAAASVALRGVHLSHRLLEARSAGDAAAHRWASLARLSDALAQSLDLAATVDAILEGIVPYLADWAILDAVDETGRFRRSSRHVSPRAREIAASLRCFPFGASAPRHGILKIHPQGLLLEEVRQEDLLTLAPAEELPAVGDLHPTSLVVLPLSAVSAIDGALTIAVGESGQRYDEQDFDLFRMMAHQAGLGLKSAIKHEQALRARQEREEVLAIVSHDLKNPLNTIGFAAAILAHRDMPENRKAEQVPIIQRAVHQMDELITDLLDAARIDAGRFSVEVEPQDPTAIVDEALEQVQPLADGAGVEISTSLEGPLPAVDADRKALLRVFGNLLANAISFTPRGGSVSVVGRPGDAEVVFEIRDSGPGIEPDMVERIFDRYWQARRQGRAGAGLGLSIARGIVLAHRGAIHVESRKGEGATFRFRIPTAERRDPPPAF